MKIAEWIAEAKARAEAATPGPWTRDKPPRDEDGWVTGMLVAGTPGKNGIYANPPGGSFPSADANFIAAARTDTPRLIALLEEAIALGDAMVEGEPNAVARLEWRAWLDLEVE
jgi:hypothetical protein